MKNVLALATAARCWSGCASQGVLTRGEAKTGCARARRRQHRRRRDGRSQQRSSMRPRCRSTERGPTPAATITPGGAAVLQGAGSRSRPVDPKAPADPVRGQPADAVERPLGAVRRRWLQRRADHRASVSCPRRRMSNRRRWRRASSPSAPIRATRTSRTSRRRLFALNDEALLNFAHASYKKVRDVSVELMKRAYGRAPDKAVLRGQQRRRARRA